MTERMSALLKLWFHKLFAIKFPNGQYPLKELMNLPTPHCFTYKIETYPAYHMGALNIQK